MEDEAWLTRLLDACRAALDRVRDSALDVDRSFVSDLESYCAGLEQRLSEVRGAPPDDA